MLAKLLPKKTDFFGLFSRHIELTVEAARALEGMLDRLDQAEAESTRIRELEHRADALAHQAIETLHRTFVTPIDRSDIHALASRLDDDEVTRLYAALRGTLAAAVQAASGKPAKELKDAKRAGMRVHGRTGETCPECGDVVREVSFADSSLQYCATCQTGGKPLADRRTSKFLK